MLDCAIFRSFANVETIWPDVHRLVDNVPSMFAEKNIDASFRLRNKTEVNEEEYSNSRVGFHFHLSGGIAGQRSSGQILLAFDMLRTVAAGSWPYARTALLTIAYARRFNFGWELQHVLMGTDGRPEHEDARAGCVSHASGRLLEWPGQGATRWSDRDWLFSVPMARLNGKGSFGREIVEPVAALLVDDADPEIAFEGRSAVRFNM